MMGDVVPMPRTVDCPCGERVVLDGMTVVECDGCGHLYADAGPTIPAYDLLAPFRHHR